MDALVVIIVVGLSLALAAALLVIRRRTDDLDRLVADGGVTGAAGSRDAAPAAAVAEAGHDRVPSPGAPAAPRERAEDSLLPVGVLRIGPDHRITTATERAHVLLGASGPLVGRSVMEALLDARLEAALDAVSAGASATLEHRTGAGDPRLLLVRAHRLAPEDLVVVLEDITELRRLQQIRTEFIDNLGHELRTPLSTVTLLAETLAREAEVAEVPQRMRERITRIEVETGHLAQMVSEMLDLARIEGGTQLRRDDDVDLGRLAVASVERLRLFAERSGVTLVADAEPGLPAIRGDEARLGQVIVNLVHNAVKFSPDGGEVRVAVRLAGDALSLTVTDHGIGIRRADQARIFERFYKVDRARVRGGGTGLGLAIARHVVEGHGGRISVESEEGAGSVFIVTIPLGERSPGGAERGEPPPPAVAPDPA